MMVMMIVMAVMNMGKMTDIDLKNMINKAGPCEG